MTDVLLADLRDRIACGQVACIVGAGVSMAASRRDEPDPTASWTGLLEHGARYCYELLPSRLPEGWLERVLGEIRSGDMDDLLSAAEKISAKLEAPTGGAFGRWLQQSVGRLSLLDRRVPDALARLAELGNPLLTTNYDGLLEQAADLPAVTWRESAKVEEVLRGDRQAIVHLHGYWDEPETVILGLRSYDLVLGDEHAQAMLRAWRAVRTLLFVGCGAGLQDPNFGALLAWSRQVFRGSRYPHYRLAADSELAEARSQHRPEDRIHVLPYGEHHELAGYLHALAPERPRDGSERGASLARSAEKPAPLPDSVLRYLAWGYRRHRHLGVVGFEERHKIQLEAFDIFVDLSLRTGRRKLDAEPPHHRDRTGEPFVEAEQVHTDLDGALRLMAEQQRLGLVLLGAAGAGKTTLLKHLFCQHCTALRPALCAPEPDAADERRTILPHGLMPVLLRLGRVRERDMAPNGLAAFLSRELEAVGFAEAGRVLSQGDRRLLLLLDGLDEVRDERRRAQVVDWLGSEAAYWSGSPFVVTCRFSAYEGAAKLDSRFIAADIQWLDEPKVQQLVKRWYGAAERGLGGSEARAAAQADELLTALFDRERQSRFRLREMTHNPLLLSTLCLMHLMGEELPEKRAKLYSRCISLLLETWTKRRDGTDGLPAEAARQVLQPLAWAMHQDEARCYTAEQIRGVIAEPLGQVRALALGPDELVRRLRDDCGLLVRAGQGGYEFLHLSFQEYLAAAHARNAGLYAELAAKLGEPFWRETILLAMSLDGMLRPFLEAVIERQPQALVAELELLRECFAEAERVDPAPLLPLVAPSTATPLLTAALILLRRTPFGAVRARAGALLDHDDRSVRVLAREVADLPPERPSTPPTPLAEKQRRKASKEAPPATPSAPAARAEPAEGASFVEPLTGLELLWVPSGRFLMGSSKTKGSPGYDPEADDDERPAHQVELSRGYWIGRHPVTNKQYEAFLRAALCATPSAWKNPKLNQPEQPVVGVDWHDARAFCRWLTQAGGLPLATRAELPTEAQWERAARGTDGRKYPWGSKAPTGELACFGQDLSGRTEAVGGRPAGASPIGCEDMAGNVWQWCLDRWRDDYRSDLAQDPEGSAVEMGIVTDPCHQGQRDASPARLVRGGAWVSRPWRLRCAARLGHHPEVRDVSLGFRVACVVCGDRMAAGASG